MAKVNYENNPPSTTPIADIPQMKSKKDLVSFYQTLFPDLKEKHLDTVVSLSIRAIAYGQNGRALYKKSVWERSKSFPELDENVMKLLLQELQKDHIVKTHTDIAALQISRDWSLGSTPNSKLWRDLKQQRSGGFSAATPNFEDDGQFKLKIYPIVVNPDDETEVWGMSPPFDKEILFGDRPVNAEAWDRVREKFEGLEETIGLHQVHRLLRPKIKFIWSLEAPDGEMSGNPLRQSIKKWADHPYAVAWAEKKKSQIKDAHAVVAGYAAALFMQDVLGEKSPFPVNLPSDQTWDFVSSPPRSTWAQMISYLEELPPEWKKESKNDFLNEVSSLPFSKKGLTKNTWEHLPSIRQAASDLSFVTDDDIEKIIEREGDEFVSAFNKNIVGKITTLSAKEKNVLLDLLYWNNCDIPEDLKNVLMGVEENIVVTETVTPQKIVDNTSSSIDWAPLLTAFGVDHDAERSSEFDVHPFENWMMRLSPPKPVEESTKVWIEENNVFNNINRMILRKKDSEDVTMNTKLVTKLKNVIETSNKIMDESGKSGGWWGRVRKNLSSSGTTTEQWADVYIDFQDHLRGMFEEINKQLERDKVWLDYADKIKVSADKTSKEWHGWLLNVATDLDQERTAANQDEGAITSEQKIEWTNKVGTLDSAQSALEHINTAVGISSVLLEKVRQSVSVKEKLQQRTMMFYWSSLNLFAGLQSLQRTTSHIGDQAQLVEEMAEAFQSTLKYSLKEEMEQKEKIRDAFKHMALSEDGMKEFYKTLASFQKDTVAIMADLSNARQQMQEETAEVAQLSSAKVKQKQKEMTMEAETPAPSKPQMK